MMRKILCFWEGTAMAAGKTANELRLETLKAELLSMPGTDPRCKAVAREASDTLFKISDAAGCNAPGRRRSADLSCLPRFSGWRSSPGRDI